MRTASQVVDDLRKANTWVMRPPHEFRLLAEAADLIEALTAGDVKEGK